MAELANLKSKRGVIKSNLTRLKTHFNSINKNQLNDNLISELLLRLSKIESSLDEFDDVQFRIEQASVGEDEESQPDEAERSGFESTYFKLTGDIGQLCRKYQEEKQVPSSLSQSSVASSRHSNSVTGASALLNSPVVNTSTSSMVKLPPIRIPNFDGQYGNWLEFKDAFVVLVDSNNSLNDIQKFYYLRSSLENKVLEIIKSIEVSAANYKIAWDILVDRFENKKLIIFNHIRAIFEHPSLIKESYVDLRNLYESVTKHLRSLKNLGESTDKWDTLIIYIMINKFDSTTRRDWETYKYQNNLPSMQDLNSFLKSKCEVLEKLEVSVKNKPQNTGNKLHSKSFLATDNDSQGKGKYKCYYCRKPHGIFKCEQFLKLNVDDRINAVKHLKLCLNCLRDSHPSWRCQRPKCFKCKKSHNSLLHSDSYLGKNQTHNNQGKYSNDTCIGDTERTDRFGQSQSDDGGSRTVPAPMVSLNTHHIMTGGAGEGPVVKTDYSQVLLSTVIIKLIYGEKSTYARGLLDSGSQGNFISKKLCNKLNLPQSKINHAVKGVGQTLTSISNQVNVSIKSCITNFSANIKCLVLPRITDNLPAMSFNKNLIKIPINLPLADPNFNISGEIDILLGSDIFWSIIGSDQIRFGPYLPILQETKFGYVVAGSLNAKLSYNNMSLCCLNVNDSYNLLNNNIIKFWEIEEINQISSNMTESEKYCERYFDKTVKRDRTGRFIVNIPFKNNLEKLGKSFDMALKRFNLLEKKLEKDSDLKVKYTEFMAEYENLGHMSVVIDSYEEGYYIPHHAVIKNDSITTKCRVVFDASAKTTTGLSLNDTQFVGPKLQQDIFSILARFRSFKYVMTGDISKMYRQILINKNERHYQKIIWRSQASKELKVYKLNTVTYGTASAPYLAVRCLKQIANEIEGKCPKISKIIKRDFYMDDLLTGSNTIEELLEIQDNIVTFLLDYGFELRKFLCNDQNVLKKFKINKELDASILNIGENEQNKTLGVYWDSNYDLIKYKVSLNKKIYKVTKRNILSSICQIFDPLGLLGPIIINSKLIIQELWKLKLEWDEEISTHVLNNWISFREELSDICHLKIPRCVIFSQYITIEMHGFCDASIKAYGACIYIRCAINSEKFISNLLCAKSRVAPLKQISLPRLELCGALLLANLAKRIFESLEISFNSVFYWTDSTIALCWIKNESSKWKTFVANRVSEIRSLTDYNNWNHVQSEENPADLLSRGTSVKYLASSSLWWYGPKWFFVDKCNWNIPNPEINLRDIPEQSSVSYFIIKHNNELIQMLTDSSNFKRTLRVLAYVLRFLSNIKPHLFERIKGKHLLPQEIERALYLVIKHVQIECFSQDYNNLQNNRELSKTSQILSLNPFLQDGLLRVGGRIRNSCQSFEKKHPIILPSNHVLTTYIIRNEHERLLHCGVQHLLYSIREKYWPISGRNTCKKIVRNCINCFRVSPRNETYLMGDLPDIRVNPSVVFLNVGTDFGGPFRLKDRLTRGSKIIKAYICLFICMSTKAIHIEVVSELTTAAFLAAFNRFCSRRGRPTNVFSDNGSNYLGANLELVKIHEFLKNNTDYISRQLLDEKVKWHFIPAQSPSFGGIWEAGIKSAKSHIKRVIGESLLNFEQFSTVMTQIEGILNSRPLCPLTEDPDDILALTPGHFLIGRPITSLPELDLVEVPENRLTKWQHLQFVTQHFWNRWQKEYLSELQTRTKWKQNCQQLLKIGTLVLIKNDNVPPLRWQLGRVVTLHPGKDGIIRVVDLRVSGGGVLTRAVNRICALPLE